eukprot:13187843-Heterocapsa_arctica.AAC.1
MGSPPRPLPAAFCWWCCFQIWPNELKHALSKAKWQIWMPRWPSSRRSGTNMRPTAYWAKADLPLVRGTGA